MKQKKHIPSIREGIEDWYDEQSLQSNPVEQAISWLKEDGYEVPAIATRHDVVCLCEAVNLAAKFDPMYYDIKTKLVAYTGGDLTWRWLKPSSSSSTLNSDSESKRRGGWCSSRAMSDFDSLRVRM